MQTFQGSRGWPHAPFPGLLGFAFPEAVFAHDLAHRIFYFLETIMEIAQGVISER